MTVEVPLFDLSPVLQRAGNEAAANVAAVFSAGRFILGQQVANFEIEFAAAMGGTQAVGTATGTAAIELCLRAAGVGPGQEVIIPANTSLFTAQAVLATGARIRFADVDGGTLQLTPGTVSAAWTDRTSAVVGVHLYGSACPVPELASLCHERGAVLVQDACQAHGLRVDGHPLTDFSPFTAYSFYPTKNLGGVGDGGAVVTSSPEIAAHLRLLRDGGRDNDQWARVPAINSRLSELHAAYLRAFLPHLGFWNGHRRNIASVYAEALRDMPRVATVAYSAESVYHLYVVRTPKRDGLKKHLRSAGIESGVHYPHALHEHPAFAEHSSWGEEPRHAVQACSEVLSLPMGPHVSEQAACRVVAAIERFFR